MREFTIERRELLERSRSSKLEYFPLSSNGIILATVCVYVTQDLLRVGSNYNPPIEFKLLYLSLNFHEKRPSMNSRDHPDENEPKHDPVRTTFHFQRLEFSRQNERRKKKRKTKNDTNVVRTWPCLDSFFSGKSQQSIGEGPIKIQRNGAKIFHRLSRFSQSTLSVPVLPRYCDSKAGIAVFSSRGSRNASVPVILSAEPKLLSPGSRFGRARIVCLSETVRDKGNERILDSHTERFINYLYRLFILQ